MVIDAFVHCGRTKYLPVEKYEETMVECGIDGALLVQHEGEYDNSYLASIVNREGGRFQAIGLVDSHQDDPAPCVAALLDGSRHGVPLCGVRMGPDMLTRSPGSLAAVQAHKGTIVLHLMEGLGRYVDLLRHIADEFPEILLYVPHLGWPLVDGKATSNWHATVEAMRDLPRVVFGLSAIHYFSRMPLPHRDIWPHVRHVVATLGAERVVWASDFPLLLEQASVRENLGLFRGEALGLDEAQRAAILGGTAARCWDFCKQGPTEDSRDV